MSIVICVVENDKKFYLASDKRAITNGIVNDNYQKIYELKNHIYFAMTGKAKAGLTLLNKIISMINQPVSYFLKELDKEFQVNNTQLTILIAGLDENNKYFIWQKNNLGEITNADIGADKIAFSISANDNMELYDNFFQNCVTWGIPIQYSITRTINYASSFDTSISPNYDLIMFDK